MTTHQKPYPAEFRDRALRMMKDHRRIEDSSIWGAAQAVGEKLGVSAHTLNNWFKQARRDTGEAAGLSTDEIEELRRLRRENKELKRANEILKSASAFFAKELDRPTTR